MKILGIETSCDETGLAIIDARGGVRAPKFRVLKSVVASQIKIHRPFGGVVPNLAKREHLRSLPILLRQISRKVQSAKRATDKNSDSRFAIGAMPAIDMIAVTVGPGLEPALWTGINFAQSLRDTLMNADGRKRGFTRIKNKSAPILVGANHLEGHLYSFLLPNGEKKAKISNSKFLISKVFPAIALIVSGGHTILLKMDSLVKWRKLGETRDDAAGEAFDKVARLLQLPYPGGPEIEKLALRQAQGKHPRGTINFPRPMIHDKSYDFSFSGLKTAVLYYLRNKFPSTNNESVTNLRIRPPALLRPPETTSCRAGNAKRAGKFATNSLFADVGASFQQAAIDVLVAKTIRAAKQYRAKSVMLSGGVASNKLLRKTLKKESEKIGANFFAPDIKYNLDNAAMIAAAGYFAHLRKKKYKLEAQGNLGI